MSNLLMFGSVQSQWISYLSGLTEDTILLSGLTEDTVLLSGLTEDTVLLSGLTEDTILLSGLTEDTILLYYSACLSLTVISSAPKASWVFMYTMNNHTYNARYETV